MAGGSVLISLLLGSGAALAAGQVELVSRVSPRKTSDTAAGVPAAADLPAPSISANGRWVAFLSGARNLVPGQKTPDSPESLGDVFLHDRVSGATLLASHSTASPATTSSAGATNAVLSADGRWVAFFSQSTDLTADPSPSGTSRPTRLFLFDSVSGATTRVDASAFLDAGNGSGVWEVALSADGRFVAFTSDAPDLVPGQQDGNYFLDVFLYDRTTAQTSLVSHASVSATTAGDGPSQNLSISADGRFIAFDSIATDVVPGHGDFGVFLYDRLSGTVRFVDHGSNPKVSADGGTVLFFSNESALVSGQVDANGGPDLFLYDRASATTTLVTHAAGLPTTTADTPTYVEYGASPCLSGDGRFVAFVSAAHNLVPGQTVPVEAGKAVFLFDRTSGAVTLVSGVENSPTTPTSYGDEPNAPSISADGRFVAFLSRAGNIVPGQADTADFPDVFLFDRNAGRTILVSAASGSPSHTGDGSSGAPTISADGSQIAFNTTADNLVPGAKDFNNGEDVVLYDTAARTNAYATPHAPGEPSLTPDAPSALRGLSADGRFVLYENEAVNLVAGQVDRPRTTDVFLRDRATATNLLVSHAAAGRTVAADGPSSQSVLSADGRYVAFLSMATNLVAGVTDRPIPDPEPGDPASYADLFLFDRITGGTAVVSRSAVSPGLTADGPSSAPSLSGDGRYLAFLSSATDLVVGLDDANGADDDVFLFDRVTGAVTLVTRSSAAPLRTAASGSFNPLVSADGRYVVYESQASDLVPGQTGGGPNVFLYDRVAATTTLVSHRPGLPNDGAGGSFLGETPSLSADGRFIVFSSSRGDLAPHVPDPALMFFFYLYDRANGSLTFVGGSYSFNQPRLTLSANGRWITFLSNAELIPGTSPAANDQVYLYNRLSGTLTLVTASALVPGQAAQGASESSAVSADGRYVAFYSFAPDLVSGPSGSGRHVFLYDRIAASLTEVEGPASAALSFADAPLPFLSANGRQVAFDSPFPDLVAGDFNRLDDVFLFSLDAAPPPPGGPVTLPPCTLFTVQALRSGVPTAFPATGTCGVPAGVKQVAVKVTVSQATGKGNVQLYAGNVTSPAAGILRFDRGASGSAGFTVSLAANGTGTLALLPFVAGHGKVRVTVEVDGYTP